jgi:hypothetical protein
VYSKSVTGMERIRGQKLIRNACPEIRRKKRRGAEAQSSLSARLFLQSSELGPLPPQLSAGE